MGQTADNSNLLLRTGQLFRIIPSEAKKICKARAAHLLSAHQTKKYV
jgi:hypothetical protein